MILFVLALVLLIVLLFLLPPDPAASNFENRVMASPPGFNAEDVLSGKFSNDLEAFLADSIAFRTAFLRLSTTMVNAYGMRLGGPTLVDVDFGDLGAGLVAGPGREGATGATGEQNTQGGQNAQGGQGGQSGQGEQNAQDGQGGQDTQGGQNEQNEQNEQGGHGEQSAQGGQSTQNEQNEQGSQGGQDAQGGSNEQNTQNEQGNQGPFTLPPSSGRRIRPGDSFGVDIHFSPDVIFYGRFYVDGETVTQYVNTINSYRQGLPDSVRIFCLLAPSLAEFLDARYSGGDGVQKKAINNVYGRLEGVAPVDAYKWIAERVAGEYLYLRTDHHWTTLGAYYAYLAYTEAAGLAPVTIDNYIEFAFPGYIGSMITGAPEKYVLDNPDTLYYYQIDDGTTFSQSLIVIPENMDDMGYRVFMDGDHPILDYTSSNKNGKMLIVIKDSFANALIPWISPNYERIVVIDPRLYTGSVRSLISGSMDTDVLFVNTSLTPSLPGFVEKLGNVR